MNININDEKLKDIKDVYDMLAGGFIRKDTALYKIGQILQADYMRIKNTVVASADGITVEVFKEDKTK